MPRSVLSSEWQQSDSADLQFRLNQHLEATGGRAALESLRSIERIGRFSFRKGDVRAEGAYRTCIWYPDSIAISIDAAPIQINRVLHKGIALQCASEFQSCSIAEDELHKELQLTAQRANRELLFQNTADVQNVSTKEVDGVVHFRYELDGVSKVSGFDTETGLLSFSRSGSQFREYSEWRRVADIKIPFLLEDRYGEDELVSVSLNEAYANQARTNWCQSVFDTVSQFSNEKSQK